MISVAEGATVTDIGQAAEYFEEFKRHRFDCSPVELATSSQYETVQP